MITPRNTLQTIATLLLLITVGCARHSSDELLKQATDAISTGRWHLAEDTASDCLDAAPDNLEAHILLGIAYHELQKTRNAVSILEKATQLAPDHFAPHYYLGWVLAESNNYAEALISLRKAHELRPDHTDTLILLGRCCLEQNLAEEGTRYLTTLKSLPVCKQSSIMAASVYNGLANLFLNQGQVQAAARNYIRAVEKAPQNPVILQNLAVLYDQYLQEPALALQYYRYCISACQAAGDSVRQAQIQQRLRQLARQRRSTENS